MAETLKKVGTVNWALTYGSTMPFTMHVADFKFDIVSGLKDVTGGSLGRAYTTDDLVDGTLTVTGFMTLASNIALLSTVWQQLTPTADNDSTKLVQLTCTTGTGTNDGASGDPIEVYAMIERAPFQASKTSGYVAGMIVFRLIGTSD